MATLKMLLYLYIPILPILSIFIFKCPFIIVSHNKDNAHWSIFSKTFHTNFWFTLVQCFQAIRLIANMPKACESCESKRNSPQEKPTSTRSNGNVHQRKWLLTTTLQVRSYDRQSFLVACSMRAKHGQDRLRRVAKTAWNATPWGERGLSWLWHDFFVTVHGNL